MRVGDEEKRVALVRVGDERKKKEWLQCGEEEKSGFSVVKKKIVALVW